MSTFYSELADRASASNTEDFDDDLDDILDGLDASGEREVRKNDLKLTGGTGNDSLNSKSGNASDDSLRTQPLSQKSSGEVSRVKARKNLLDSLMAPFEQEETNKESKEGKSASEPKFDITSGIEQSSQHTVSRRSVRFSDLFTENDAEEQLPEKTTNTSVSLFDEKPVPRQTRQPHRSLPRPNTASKVDDKLTSSLESFMTEKTSHGKPPRDSSSGDGVSALTRLRRPSSLDSMTTRGDDLDFPIPTIGGIGKERFGSENNSLKTTELEAKVKRLEMEKANFDVMIKLLKKQHQEELVVVEKASKSKFDLLEESANRREKRLKEELQFLEEQNRERMQTLEQQRERLTTELSQRLNEIRLQNASELEHMKNLHEQELAALKTAHDEAMLQIKLACQKETSLLGELAPNTDNLKRMLEQLGSAATELSRMEQERLRELQIKQELLVRKEEALHSEETRLKQKEDALDRERKRTADLLAKLEYQMKENLKSVTEERWGIKQEQDRLAKMQTEIEEERRSLLEQAGRERAEIQQVVTSFLTEHRKLYSKNAEERSHLAEQTQKLRADQLAWEEKRNEEEATLRRMREELDTVREALAKEKRMLDERANNIRIDEVKLDETRRQLEIVRCDLARQQATLDDREHYLADQLAELTSRSDTVRQAEKALTEAETRQQQLRQEHNKQLSELKARTERLRETEKGLVTERKELAKQHADLLRLRQKLGVDGKLRVLCADCQVPVRDMASARPLNSKELKRFRRSLDPTTDIPEGASTNMNGNDHTDEDSRFLEQERKYLARVQKTTNHLFSA